jgi:hypothetical protein
LPDWLMQNSADLATPVSPGNTYKQLVEVNMSVLRGVYGPQYPQQFSSVTRRPNQCRPAVVKRFTISAVA